MKKILFFIALLVVVTQSFGKKSEHKKWSTALTSGYVFKNDDEFKQVYGRGMINALTADGCFYPWKHWGFGLKAGYWRAKGRTTFLDQPTLAQEVPMTAYFRYMHAFKCGLQLQGSLGGGFSWIQEKSYFQGLLDRVRTYKGIGEVEVGLNYSVWRGINVTGAFRYLFPPQSQKGERIDVGGCDLRAGIGFLF